MIATQQIKNTTSVVKKYENFTTINVLKWKNNKWKNLSPYCLKTDGNEKNFNNGGIIFENFYQGSKIFDKVYNIKVYASKYHINNSKYLWWEYNAQNENYDELLNENDEINYELYTRWRDSLWNCNEAIRYPNGINRRKNVQFGLIKKQNGKERRLNYLDTRKKIYVREYKRLIKQTDEYKELLNKLINGENLLICEVDVPANGKHGEYGNDCDENNNCIMNIDKLKILLNDETEAFGHGLVIAYSLLKDLQRK